MVLYEIMSIILIIDIISYKTSYEFGKSIIIKNISHLSY